MQEISYDLHHEFSEVAAKTSFVKSSLCYLLSKPCTGPSDYPRTHQTPGSCVTFGLRETSCKQYRRGSECVATVWEFEDTICLSLLSRSISDHHLRCGGWLKFRI